MSEMISDAEMKIILAETQIKMAKLEKAENIKVMLTKNTLGCAFQVKDIHLNGRALKCLVDNEGRILTADEINEILVGVREFYKIDIADEIIELYHEKQGVKAKKG